MNHSSEKTATSDSVVEGATSDRQRQPMRGKRVVIIGGGLAGLSAAEAIKSAFPDRFDVTLLEAKQVVGGRAGSFNDPATGEAVDYCQHVAMGCCTNLISLLERCGLDDQLNRYRKLVFLHPDHPPSPFAPARWLPAPLHLVNAFGSMRFLTLAQRREVRRAMLRLFQTTNEKLRDQTAAEWLVENGQSPATIRDFWDVILISALGERPTVVSMSAARKVFVDGFAGAVGASDVLVPKQPLAELFGRKLRAAIERLGVRVLTGKTVKELIREPEIAVRTQSGDPIPADHVIMAVPWFAISNLLPAELVPDAAKLADLPVSPISGLHLWFDRQFTDQDHAVMVGTVSQWMFRQPWEEASEVPDRKSEHYYQIVISASHDTRQMDRKSLLETVVGEIHQAYPKARDAKLLRYRVVTDPKSVFSVRPEVERIRPPAQTKAAWFHLAGDWTATGWPATMEGAVISGRNAASSLCSQEGLGEIASEDGLPRGILANWLIR
ncbi:MAG: hydroxysqualene dehydroxylase HpnE [Planctomycetota bacterium]